eukprot:TRINITY_DN31001_c0_g1_i1.p1 TRINITY_DN31001_c0_g1~~TRINITY_DN31001_c0_g1_i1.p1  ORF type:complete len:243 (-),score=46.47 TRINITY_DN31001_c0_g1_i1:38-766(-)
MSLPTSLPCGGHRSVSPPPAFVQPQGMMYNLSSPSLQAQSCPSPYVHGSSIIVPSAASSVTAPSQFASVRQTMGTPLTARAAPTPATSLQAEVARRKAAESRVAELEALVDRLRARVATLEGKRPGAEQGRSSPGRRPMGAQKARHEEKEMEPEEDAIDEAIRTYLEHNPDFPVSIQKVAPNFYVFGDRGTVFVQQRGAHIVVRVGGGYKSLQVFMDERALMVTRDNAAAVRKQAEAAARRN